MSAVSDANSELRIEMVVYHQQMAPDLRISRLERENQKLRTSYDRGVECIKKFSEELRENNQRLLESCRKSGEDLLGTSRQDTDTWKKAGEESIQRIEQARKEREEWVKKHTKPQASAIPDPDPDPIPDLDSLSNFPNTPAGANEHITIAILRSIHYNIKEAKKIFTLDITIGRFFICLLKISSCHLLLIFNQICMFFSYIWRD